MSHCTICDCHACLRRLRDDRDRLTRELAESRGHSRDLVQQNIGIGRDRDEWHAETRTLRTQLSDAQHVAEHAIAEMDILRGERDAALALKSEALHAFAGEETMADEATARAEKAEAREAELLDVCLRLIDQSSDRTWCQVCRTEQRWPRGDGDRTLHLHATMCPLDRYQSAALARLGGGT